LALPSLYFLKVLILTAAMALPFHFFNKYLQQKINPRESGKNLLLYFAIVILFLLVYISIFMYLFIKAVKIFI
jgi:small-conductance mechanosensitive channel